MKVFSLELHYRYQPQIPYCRIHPIPGVLHKDQNGTLAGGGIHVPLD